MNRMLALGLASTLAVALLPGGALAGDAQYHRAQVTGVTPIMQVVRVSTPHEECWTEQMVHHDRRRDNRAGMVVGGIAGGVLGNRIGRGDGRKIATVAGTILGAAVGDQLGRRPARSYTTNEHRCQTVERWYDEERTVGYRVQYRFRGDTFWTEMDHHPGDTIRVRVDVTPVR
ncbi:MAG: glycine zipper 2TM domain-containing protein [Aquisalimonadaceae bacterium]